WTRVAPSLVLYSLSRENRDAQSHGDAIQPQVFGWNHRVLRLEGRAGNGLGGARRRRVFLPLNRRIAHSAPIHGVTEKLQSRTEMTGKRWEIFHANRVAFVARNHGNRPGRGRSNERCAGG